MKVNPRHSVGLGLVAPFLLLGPALAVVAGVLATGAGHEVFVAINTGRLVAMTHAVVLGWVGLSIMGATYQLGSAVLGGRPLSTRLIRVQFAVHIVALALFIWALLEGETMWTGIAGSLLVTSLLLFLLNASRLVTTASGRGAPRSYMAMGLLFLVAAGSFGITYAGNLEHGWFPMSMGKLAAHAHLGLVGWVGLTLMGVSYQLVPMFNVAPGVRPRFATPALVLTGAATLAFASGMLFDPGVEIRVMLVLLLASGPLLWSIDQWRILHGRNRRRLDVQGLATIVSLCFLVLAILLGLGAALGTPFTPGDEPARWPIAYGAAGILGWAGTAVAGNAIKIHAFLVWLHRNSKRAGSEPVPLVSDLYSEAAARTMLAVHVAATCTFIAGALTGALSIFQLGGLLLAVSAAMLGGVLGSMYIPVRGRGARRAPTERRRTA